MTSLPVATPRNNSTRMRLYHVHASSARGRMQIYEYKRGLLNVLPAEPVKMRMDKKYEIFLYQAERQHLPPFAKTLLLILGPHGEPHVFGESRNRCIAF